MGPEVLDSQPFVPLEHIPDVEQHNDVGDDVGRSVGEDVIDDRSPSTVVGLDDGEMMEMGLVDDGFFVFVGFLVGFTVLELLKLPPCASTVITDSSSSNMITIGRFDAMEFMVFILFVD